MANAENLKGSTPPFFPIETPRTWRGASVKAPFKAANMNESMFDRPADAKASESVWATYQSESTSGVIDPNQTVLQVHSSKRWLVRGLVGVAFVAAIGVAAATRNPPPVVSTQAAADSNTSAGVENPRSGDAFKQAAALGVTGPFTTPVKPALSSAKPESAAPKPIARAKPTQARAPANTARIVSPSAASPLQSAALTPPAAPNAPAADTATNPNDAPVGTPAARPSLSAAADATVSGAIVPETAPNIAPGDAPAPN